LDLLDADAARGWAEHLVERFGGVDAVAHLVGGWRGGQSIADAPLEDYDWLHDLLVRTVQHVSRAFLPALKTSGGRFVLVSSAQAQAPTSTNASYAAAKAAAETWTLALADELSADGGAANILVVNAIVTPEMRAADPEKAFKTFTDAADIAAAIAFLFGDAASKMNGQRLSLHP
jgi:NAD(P)-dependent dehydrogenase (short-subunit alcohol dehydrogenase family)